MLPPAIFTLSAVLESQNSRPRIASVISISVHLFRNLLSNLGPLIDCSGKSIQRVRAISRAATATKPSSNRTSPQHVDMSPTASILVWAQDPTHPG